MNNTTPNTILTDKYFDIIFLSTIIIASMIPYINGIGFYTDDWLWLSNFELSQEYSFIGLYKSSFNNWVAMRPAQVLFHTFLYWICGTDPYMYQIINSVIFISGIVLFYLILRKVLQNRMIALSIAVIYSILPHYSSDRFWVSGFALTFSMSTYFLSLWCDLKCLQTDKIKLITLKAISILSLLLSTLTYEIFIALFFMNPLIVWYRNSYLSIQNNSEIQTHSRKIVLSSIFNLTILCLVIAYKLTTTVRMGEFQGIINQFSWFMDLIFKAIDVSYITYGIELPRTILHIIKTNFTISDLVTALLIGLIIFSYTFYIMKKSTQLKRDYLLKLAICGLIVFILGYAIFLTNRNVGITPTGTGNRIAIAATIGVAISNVGILGFLISYIHNIKFRKILLCSLISAICMASIIINNTLAKYWVAAYQEQKKVMNNLITHNPDLQDQSTIIIDGVCQFLGPAPIFIGHDDVSNSIKLIYRNKTLQGNIFGPKFKLVNNSFHTSVYNFSFSYPISNNLYIFNNEKKQMFHINSIQEAQYYLNNISKDYNLRCPFAYPGIGVTIF